MTNLSECIIIKILNHASHQMPKSACIFWVFCSKSASGIHNALYILPRALYMILRESFIYFLATVKIEEKQ